MLGAVRIRRVLPATILCFAMLCPAISFSQDDSDDKWSLREWPKLVERLFPQKPDNSIVAMRIVDDGWHKFPEYSFSLVIRVAEKGNSSPGGVVAEVREARGGSIYKQIVALHRRNPALTGNAIQKLVLVNRFRLPEKDCPDVRTQFEKFKQLRMAPLQFQGAILDAPRTDFWINAGDGSMLISIDAGPGSQDYPLLVWANETRRSLDSCHAQLTKTQ
jgi:hypothetical protein